MGRLLKKLEKVNGESLAEALISILVIALTAAILATAVTASAKVNMTADTASEEMYDKLNAAAAGETDHSGTVAVTVTGAFEDTLSFNVLYTGDGELTAYYLTGGGG